MNWLSLILGVIALVREILNYVRERKLITAAGEAIIAKALKEQANEIERGNKARANAERDALKSALVPDDGFRRD